MKKIIVLIMSVVLCFTLVACGGGGDDASNAPQEEKVYAIGETWEVDGQWKLTINSVTATDERNEFAAGIPRTVF